MHVFVMSFYIPTINVRLLWFTSKLVCEYFRGLYLNNHVIPCWSLLIKLLIFLIFFTHTNIDSFSAWQYFFKYYNNSYMYLQYIVYYTRKSQIIYLINEHNFTELFSPIRSDYIFYEAVSSVCFQNSLRNVLSLILNFSIERQSSIQYMYIVTCNFNVTISPMNWI